jgi:hypothetical protein
MEEEKEQFSTNSDEETHNAEDEPDSYSDTDKIRADLNYRINQYLLQNIGQKDISIDIEKKIDTVVTITAGEPWGSLMIRVEGSGRRLLRGI